MTAAQKRAKENFKKAIAYRKISGCTLKEAFAKIYNKKTEPLKKATSNLKKLVDKAKKAYKEGYDEAAREIAKKKAAKRVGAAPKKAAKKKVAGYVKTLRKGVVTNVLYTNSQSKTKSNKTLQQKLFGTRKQPISKHKDTKSHNVNIKVVSGTKLKNPSEFVSLSGYTNTKEIVVGSIGKIKSLDKLIPEVKVRVTRGKSVVNDQIRYSKDSAEIFKKFIGKDKIQTQEFFAVMYLSQSNKVLGVYVHSMGSINATSADVRLILGGALRLGAVSVIVCHNHPSGNMQPSEADIQLTKKLITAAKYHDIRVLDHVIIGKDNYYSFADHNLI